MHAHMRTPPLHHLSGALVASQQPEPASQQPQAASQQQQPQQPSRQQQQQELAAARVHHLPGSILAQVRRPSP
eukprot:1275303-Prymnesium_polylepis.1